jgi:hypothetical protein
MNTLAKSISEKGKALATSIEPQTAEARAHAMALLLKFRTVLALVVVVAIFAVLAPNFLSLGNALIMLKHIAIVAILAIGMTFVILTGGIDLSVGSIAGLAGMVAGALILNGLPLTALGVVIYPSVPLDGGDGGGAGRGPWPVQWLDGQPLSGGALYRHFGHALYGARRGDADVERRDLSQSGRQSGAGQ